jgi:1-acyl-sn-glycerol-3-phosphate acyltransferase
MEILEEDDVLGIFPEGARARYWGERPIKRGAAWLSIATGAPVLPCSISGSEGTLSLIEPGMHAPAVRVSIHPPLYPGSYIDREDPLRSMMDDWSAVVGKRIGHWIREE